MMQPKVHCGIEISAIPRFIPNEGGQGSHRFLFQYKIQVTNHNIYAVQLMRRHWEIFDGFIHQSIIDGDGVVGEQPIIRKGETHTYTSFCPLSFSMGMMKGWFTFQRFDDEGFMQAPIPTMFLNSHFNNN